MCIRDSINAEYMGYILEEEMAKEKNSTSHHHQRRYHKHKIQKPKSNRYMSLKGCDVKFLRNRRRAIRFDKKQNKHWVPKKVVVKKKEEKKAAKKPGKESKKVAKKQANYSPQQSPLFHNIQICLLYTSPSPRDLSTSRMPSSA
eukprot:TRINITY_DN101_c0_g1_i2.p3 TRINITY_DN101_c0_g1~~TRINITY_DN101_c0_g1_i2.p3  ORF type:complete len:144 (+),score=28.83 TRINITY_DN101_c0_g1_i2:77-508(+)